MLTSTTTPRIYVCDLAAYNAGNLRGIWIDADQDAEDIWAEINKMLAESPEPFAEEWRIGDYENFYSYPVHEWADIEELSEIGKGIAKHGAAYALYLQYTNGQDASEDDFLERYQGCYEDKEDFAYRLWEDCGTIAELEKINVNPSYIDWEAVARDLFLDGYSGFQEHYYELHVFLDY